MKDGVTMTQPKRAATPEEKTQRAKTAHDTLRSQKRGKSDENERLTFTVKHLAGSDPKETWEIAHRAFHEEMHGLRKVSEVNYSGPTYTTFDASIEQDVEYTYEVSGR